MAVTLRQVPWPNYDIFPLTGTTIQIARPGRIVQQARETTKQVMYDVSPGQYMGTINVAHEYWDDENTVKFHAFLEDMTIDPNLTYTLVPWAKASIFNTKSNASFLNVKSNRAIGTVTRISGGLWRIKCDPLPGAGESFEITPGENFGYNGLTKRILSATPVSGQTRTWDCRVSPIDQTDPPVNGRVYQRRFLPSHFLADQSVVESERGDGFAGPYSIRIRAAEDPSVDI